MYKVKYTDSTGNNDSIQDYLTKKEAIEAIDYELDEVKEYFKARNYDYGESGNKTEIWDKDGSEYACWEIIQKQKKILKVNLQRRNLALV